MLILQIALPTPLRQLFDYLPPKGDDIENLKPGARVLVPFGKQKLIGILVGRSDHSDFPQSKLKPVLKILDKEPILTHEILKLCRWASDYYHHPLGDVFSNAFPALLRQDKETSIKLPACWSLTEQGKSININELKRSPSQMALLNYFRGESGPFFQRQLTQANFSSQTIRSLVAKNLIENRSLTNTAQKQTSPSLKLSEAQQFAFDAILKKLNRFQCFLLQGVTGSGKTEVYLQIIAQVLKQNKQALILVPEIALTPQTINRFQSRFNEVVVCLHSGLNSQERLNGWLMARSGEAKIIIGTRSTIFTPCKTLGIIIIDEEHDLSFKQQEKFRYSAKSVAIVRAQMNNIPIVLGSATPSAESLVNVVNKNFQSLSLPERAGKAIHPTYHLIDIRNKTLDHGISKPLLERISLHLDNDSQVLLFLNRRGYAPTLMCHQCGWIALCSRCDVHMTLHHQPPHLHCHHCDTMKPVPPACPQCGKKQLQNIGVGTERLEKSLRDHFPDITITRIDRDTTRRKHSIKELLETVHEGKKQILIGTQMVAKGHHFPNVTLVGIINADAGFFSADFRATERMGQLLIQVSGRAGRAEKPGEVLIQTHYPDHPFLHQLTKYGYLEFIKFVLKERQESGLPPYSHVALLRAYALNAEKPKEFLNDVKAIALEISPDRVKALGPIPAPLPRKKSHYQTQLLIQSKDRTALQETLKKLISMIDILPSSKQVKWNLDVDPLEMY